MHAQFTENSILNLFEQKFKLNYFVFTSILYLIRISFLKKKTISRTIKDPAIKKTP